MRKPLRILLRALLGLVVLLAAAALAVRYLVPADALADRAAALVAERTGAEVRLGTAHLTLWPRIRLVLDDVAIAGDGDDMTARSGGAPGVLVRYALAAERVAVDLAWGPLLRRRLELGEVGLDTPRIELVTDSGRTAASGRAGGGGAVTAAAAALQIRHGALTWRDAADGRSLRLSDWNQTVDLGDTGRLLARLRTRSGDPSGDDGAPVRVALHAGLGELLLEGFSPAGVQQLRDLEADLMLEIPATLDAWPLAVDALRWGGVEVAGTGQALMRDAGVDLRLDWHLVALDPAALRTELPSAAPNLPPAFTAWLASAEPTLTGAEAAGELVLALPFTSDDPAAEFLAGFTCEGAVADLVLPLPRMPRPWIVDAQFALRRAVFTCSDAVAQLDGGRLSGGLVIDGVGSASPICRFDLMSEGVEARTLLATVAPSVAPFIEGATDAVVSGQVRLGDPELVRRSLTLEGDVLLREGIVHASEWLGGISRYLGERQDLKEIRYASLGDHVTVRDGRVFLPGLLIDGYDTDWAGSGWIGLGGDIDLAVNVKLPPGFRPELGAMTPLAEALRGPDGRIALDLKLTGRAARPQVGLELKPAGERLGEQVQEGFKGLLDRLRDRK